VLNLNCCRDKILFLFPDDPILLFTVVSQPDILPICAETQRFSSKENSGRKAPE